MPPPVATIAAPKINSVSLTGSTQAPEVEIDGSGFLTTPFGQAVNPSTGAKVSFEQANDQTFTAYADANGSDSKLMVPVPTGAILGISQITVLRPDPAFGPDPSSPDGFQSEPQYVGSNPAQFNPGRPAMPL